METKISTRFENNFIEKTYSTIVADMSIAFSELVANAWDAGASVINISLPTKHNGEIIIEDDGAGMTADEFQDRWMVIAYNRVEHQGDYVDYVSSDRKNCKRLAYGRNGVGRHSLFCFDNEYTIETWKNGICNLYKIHIDGGQSAFSVIHHENYHKEGSGTKLTVKAKKKLPKYLDVVNTLSYRFLFDPEFKILVDGKELCYMERVHPVLENVINTQYGKLSIQIYCIPEGEKSTAMNGITFWSGKRLVGNPAWSINGIKVEDARRKFALKHIILVNADYLIDDVKYDWSEFQNTERVLDAYNQVIEYIKKYRAGYYRDKTSETRKGVIQTNIEAIEELSIPAQHELRDFFDCYLEQKPDIASDELNVIISALIQVLKSRSGVTFLSKIAEMDTRDIDVLNEILDEWSISDIKIVLDEIDKRLSVIDAIQKLCSDPHTDELHVLHPLVSQARWLFGPEYDSDFFTFNKTLTTVMEKLMKGIKKEGTSINWSKRPDLVFCDTFSLSATCTEEFDENEISIIDRVLIIELKKGGFEIGRKEISQAEEYVDSIYKGNKLNSKPKIKAFIIGDSINSEMSTYKKLEDYGEVFAYTYDQLVRTAEKRLFNLKAKLTERYQSLTQNDYLSKLLNQPRQLELSTTA